MWQVSAKLRLLPNVQPSLKPVPKRKKACGRCQHSAARKKKPKERVPKVEKKRRYRHHPYRKKIFKPLLKKYRQLCRPNHVLQQPQQHQVRLGKVRQLLLQLPKPPSRAVQPQKLCVILKRKYYRPFAGTLVPPRMRRLHVHRPPRPPLCSKLPVLPRF